MLISNSLIRLQTEDIVMLRSDFSSCFPPFTFLIQICRYFGWPRGLALLWKGFALPDIWQTHLCLHESCGWKLNRNHDEFQRGTDQHILDRTLSLDTRILTLQMEGRSIWGLQGEPRNSGNMARRGGWGCYYCWWWLHLNTAKTPSPFLLLASKIMQTP